MCKKQVVDTPREGAWYLVVNSAGFMKTVPKPKPLVLSRLSLEEYRKHYL